MRLLRTVNQYFFDSEGAAEVFVEEQKAATKGEITKVTIEKKTKKSKGEIIAEGYVCTIQEDFGKPFDDLEDAI